MEHSFCAQENKFKDMVTKKDDGQLTRGAMIAVSLQHSTDWKACRRTWTMLELKMILQWQCDQDNEMRENFAVLKPLRIRPGSIGKPLGSF